MFHTHTHACCELTARVIFNALLRRFRFQKLEALVSTTTTLAKYMSFFQKNTRHPLLNSSNLHHLTLVTWDNEFLAATCGNTSDRTVSQAFIQ